MKLDLIGTGLGRTGTLSLRSALETLGYPCYHMVDLLFDPYRKSDVDFWLEVAENPEQVDRDWTRVFAGYRATVDYPSCTVWRQLAQAYPEAKLIFTHHPRGPKGWYDSTVATIYSGTGFEAGTEFGAKVNAMMDTLVWHGLMQDMMDDEARAIARYNAHFEEVRDTIPADRLLVYSVEEGWGPLCAFLGVPVPDEPFPQVNGREHMARITTRLQRMRNFGLRR
ncbi:MAG: hypothetical protein IE927_04170 [Rhodobacterales bacterium]|nr:hypothetical protein [Rhodobacterales bacterium]